MHKALTTRVLSRHHVDIQDSGFVAPSISENQIEGMQEFNAGQYPMLDGNRSITLGSL